MHPPISVGAASPGDRSSPYPFAAAASDRGPGSSAAQGGLPSKRSPQLLPPALGASVVPRLFIQRVDIGALVVRATVQGYIPGKQVAAPFLSRSYLVKWRQVEMNILLEVQVSPTAAEDDSIFFTVGWFPHVLQFWEQPLSSGMAVNISLFLFYGVRGPGPLEESCSSLSGYFVWRQSTLSRLRRSR